MGKRQYFSKAIYETGNGTKGKRTFYEVFDKGSRFGKTWVSVLTILLSLRRSTINARANCQHAGCAWILYTDVRPVILHDPNSGEKPAKLEGKKRAVHQKSADVLGTEKA